VRIRLDNVGRYKYAQTVRFERDGRMVGIPTERAAAAADWDDGAGRRDRGEEGASPTAAEGGEGGLARL
jgi:hypothetical protein